MTTLKIDPLVNEAPYTKGAVSNPHPNSPYPSRKGNGERASICLLWSGCQMSKCGSYLVTTALLPTSRTPMNRSFIQLRQDTMGHCLRAQNPRTDRHAPSIPQFEANS